ncbi:MAG: beta-ketoacyl synthase [Pseudomonadota bacterium]|nr:beta-ketoacyl synthase [Pseudomonadota bacterium]
MKALPLIIGFGGINAAGRASFHHGYQRLVFDSLNQPHQQECLQALRVMMSHQGGNTPDQQAILDGTLIRRIESRLFDVDRVPLQRVMNLSGDNGQLQFIVPTRELPQQRPAHWQVQIEGDTARIQTRESLHTLVPDSQPYPVGAAGQIPSGFEPGATYQSRNHPRGLQLAVYAVSDALRNSGLDWQRIQQTLDPQQLGVYASSAMGQLDEPGTGGMLRSNLQGKRVSSKQCPMGFADMTADFVNAYVLGNLGKTGAMAGACATFLYNLNMAVQDIRNGNVELALVGASEAPVIPEVMEGYRAMSALAEDEGLQRLDGGGAVNHRRACRPFADNCGFTIAEASQFVVLCSDRLALELGATVFAAVPQVFIHADGVKRSISAPGVGNYLTVGRALDCLSQALQNHGGVERSFVMAHGTGTPQNRVTESHILNSLAAAFDIPQWPLAAVKCFLGHSIGSAGGDQVAAALGVFEQQILPGITTVDGFADDVHRSNLSLDTSHRDFSDQPFAGALINAKGFGGNNASAVMLSPNWCRQYLERRHGLQAWQQYQQRNQIIETARREYHDAVLTRIPESIYRFGEPEVKGEQLEIQRQQIQIPGYPPVDLDSGFDY